MVAGVTQGRLALRVQAQPIDATVALVMAELLRLYPTVAPSRPVAIHVTNWSFDDLSRGAYAAWPIGFTRAEWDVVRRPEPSGPEQGRLHFAGEHVADNFGYTHGAIDSGYDAAHLIIKVINRRRREDVEEDAYAWRATVEEAPQLPLRIALLVIGVLALWRTRFPSRCPN